MNKWKDFVQEVDSLFKEGKTATAYDKLYQVCDALMYFDDVSALKAILDKVRTLQVEDDTMYAVLAATIAFRDKLPERKQIYNWLVAIGFPKNELIGLD